MAHKTDFKDALFEQRKYRMQSNPDGTVTPVDETEYSQEGDRVGAKYFNETGEALNDLENPIFEDYTSTVAPDPEIALGLIKSKASFKALFQNIKAALLGMVFKKNVLTSMEEVNANTDEGMVAGALSVKELCRELTDSGKITGYEVRKGDGVYITYLDGADTVTKKLGSLEVYYIGNTGTGMTSSMPIPQYVKDRVPLEVYTNKNNYTCLNMSVKNDYFANSKWNSATGRIGVNSVDANTVHFTNSYSKDSGTSTAFYVGYDIYLMVGGKPING